MRQHVPRVVAGVERALQGRITHGEPGHIGGTILAQGDGWWVEDVICTLGPEDRAFEERHPGVAIGIVIAGTFHYRSTHGRELLTPGSLLLGNDDQCFECDHTGTAGDRTVAFRYAPWYFEQLAADGGLTSERAPFRASRVPALRQLGEVSARAAAAVMDPARTAWDELGVQVAMQAVRLASGLSSRRASSLPHDAERRVVATIRDIERDPASRLPLTRLAARAGLSPFHYLRTFQRVTGVTPHQFVLRTRLRDAATRLAVDASAKIADVARSAGFDDLSNFNHAFRAEFGVTPRQFGRPSRGADQSR